MLKYILSLVLTIGFLGTSSDLQATVTSPKQRKTLQSIQSYISKNQQEHSRRGEQLISSMAWDAIPDASRDVQVGRIEIAVLCEQMEYFPNQKLKTGSWIETWQVEMDGSHYSVNFLTMVKDGRMLMRLLYVGDLYDTADVWSLKYEHLMARIQEETPAFYGLMQQKGRVFMKHTLQRYDPVTGSTTQLIDVYCHGKKVSYRLQNRPSHQGDTNVLFTKIS